MRIFKMASALQIWVNDQRGKGHTLGFVPTMGALHAGHLSLISAALGQNDAVVCSIFVNPTQFNDPADFEKYPVTTGEDINLLVQAGCQVLFLPGPEEVYPPQDPPLPHYDLGHLEMVLEGEHRPGHFQGVCQVLHQFLKLFQPDRFYLGQKDFQQCMVVRRLLHLLGLVERVELHIVPTLREPGGLAMSSRNMRLTEDERKKASVIYRVLSWVRERVALESPASLEAAAADQLRASGFRVDYVAVADAATLRPPDPTLRDQRLVALAAVFLGEVRLIDNLQLN